MKFNQLLTLLVLIAIFCYAEAAKSMKLKKEWEAKRAAAKALKSSSTTTAKKLTVAGGMAANPGQFPYVVSISATDGCDDWKCTGVLIYYNYVITTAWCLDQATEVDVIIGEYDMSADCPTTRSKSRVRIYAKQWTFHESYNSTEYNTYNIGIIQLPLYLVANLNITTIPMSLVNVLNTYVGKTATVAGWGYVDSCTTTDHLLWTTLNIINTATCQVDWSDVTSTVFCAASPTTSVFQGLCEADDGAPLVYLGALLGLANNYDSNCDDRATVFTPIAPYYNWILSKTAQGTAGNFWIVPVPPT